MNDGKLLISLFLIIVLHLFVVIGNFISFFIIPFLQPWYVALPICSIIVFMTFSRSSACPLTRLENLIRGKLSLQQINGFIKFYFYEAWK